MPLLPNVLESGIESVCSNPGPSSAACAAQWAQAMGDYTQTVAPPSLTVQAAVAALTGALSGAFASPVAAPGMESAFGAFAATVGAGMAPAFVAAPPPRPVGFASLFAQPPPVSHSAAAASMTALLDGWMRTATATPASGGAPIPWT
jgi:hypothetical protein